MMRPSRAELLRELRPWAAIAWPAGLRQLVELLPWLVSLSLIGRVGTRELAALSLTETWIYAFMTASWGSASMTSSTLVSQAHGAGRVDAMRGWGAMSCVASAGLAALVTVSWLTSSPALEALGFDPALVRLGHSYVIYALPNLWLEVVNLSASTYFVSMQRASLPLVLGVASTAVDLVVSYVLIFGAPGAAALPDALEAAALGWTAAGCVSCIANCCAVRWVWGRELDFRDDGSSSDGDPSGAGGASPSRQPLLLREGEGAGLLQGWGFGLLHHAPDADKEGDSSTLLQGGGGLGKAQSSVRTWLLSRVRWRTFLGQLGPNLVTVVIATVQYTAISFMAASLGEVAIATHNAMLCLFECLHTFSSGMAEATAVRVGYHLGRGDARSARTTAVVAVLVTTAWGACVTAAGLAARNALGRIFTNDPAVLATAASLAPLMFCGYVVLCVGDACLGVLEGAGRSGAQAAAFLVATVGVGLPLAVVSWKATSLGLRGLWGALLVGYLVLDAIALVLVWRSDWPALVAQCAERAKEERAHDDEEEEEEEARAVNASMAARNQPE